MNVYDIVTYAVWVATTLSIIGMIIGYRGVRYKRQTHKSWFDEQITHIASEINLLFSSVCFITSIAVLIVLYMK